MKNIIIIVYVIMFFLPSFATADTGYFCSYLIDFELSKDPDISASQKIEYSLQDCKKGDVINITIKDSSGLGRQAIFLKAEIAEICDNTLPVAVIDISRAVCTYRGSRRSIRPRSEK